MKEDAPARALSGPAPMDGHGNDALITLDNLSIGYNGRPVLSGISLSIARDSFTVILGANGSGKSTLLKTLLGLIPPIAGRICATPAPTGAPLVFGYVPQTTGYDPIYLLTGFDVALMGTYGRVRPFRFVPSAERAFTRECLRAAGADELARQRFSELSGGQKQRVLIARALATRPDVLVLDEPTAGVDAEATHTVLEFISRTREERQITVLLVTHDFAAIRHHARQVLWIHQGKVLQGAPDELLTSERMAEIFEMGIS
jgi:ABC-type Mn2+/Zn2+ transport system ATPase subunit